MHTFLALFNWESQVIYLDLKGWTLISVPDVKQQRFLCIWKQSIVLSCKISQLLSQKIQILSLQKGKLSHRTGKLFECEHSETEHITNLTLWLPLPSSWLKEAHCWFRFILAYAESIFDHNSSVRIISCFKLCYKLNPWKIFMGYIVCSGEIIEKDRITSVNNCALIFYSRVLVIEYGLDLQLGTLTANHLGKCNILLSQVLFLCCFSGQPKISSSHVFMRKVILKKYVKQLSWLIWDGYSFESLDLS